MTLTGKGLATGALLLFVAVTLAVAVRQELRRGALPGAAPPSAGGAAGAPVPAGKRVVAYYFTGKIRCTACVEIEKGARGVIESSFPAEIASGRLRFEVVNFDAPENRHFVDEYRLDASQLVLVRFDGPARKGWKVLPELWTLVETPEKMRAFVREQVTAALAEA